MSTPLAYSPISLRPNARRPIVAVVLAILCVIVVGSGSVLAAAGDVTFSRMSELARPDKWFGVSAYDSAVYAGGYQGNNGLLRRYNRSGGFLWTRSVFSPGATTAAIRGVAADESGVYVVGYKGSHDSNEGQINEDGHAFISHYSRNGGLEWTRTINVDGATVATGVAVFGDSVYVVGGIQESDALGGPEAAFVRKYTPDGIHVWTRRIRSSFLPGSVVALLSSVAANADGVYVAGQVWLHDSGTVALWVRMLNHEGGLVWNNRRVIGGAAEAIAIAADPSGAYAVARAWASDEQRAGDPEGAAAYGAFLVKYRAADGFVWQRRVTEASTSVPGGVAVSPSGVWIGGNTRARLFNQPPGTVADPAGDMFVARYSTSGMPLMVRQYSNPGRQTGLAIDADDLGAYLVGEATEFGPRTATGPFDGLLLAIEVP